jgi:hypothetical protein
MATTQPNYKLYFRLSVILLPLVSLINSLFPSLLLKRLNRQLAAMGKINTTVNGLLISPGGTIKLLGIRITDSDPNQQVPFKFGEILSASAAINLSQLWKGILELDVKISDVVLYFLKNKDGVRSVFHALDSSPIPFKLNIPSLKVSNVELNYIDTSVQPGVELKANRLNLTATNLSSQPLANGELASHVKIDCSACEGNINIDIKGDFAMDKPVFDLNAEIKQIQLTRLNSLFLSYAKFDVNRGTLNLFIEVAMVNGQFKGYIKPVILDLDILNKEDLKKGPLQVIWQGLMGAALSVLSNPFKKELATKIPFSGSINKPRVNVGYAVFQILYSAFVQSLRLSIDNEIEVESVNREQ